MVTIYTKDYCPYCHRAKGLLDSLDIDYQEIDVTNNPEELKKASERSGFSTVPQVFVGEKCLGGCDDIHKLHEQGKLVSLCK